MKTIKNILSRVLGAAVLAILSSGAQAHFYNLGDLKIIHPYTYPTLAGSKNNGVFLGIENKGKEDDVLLGLTAERAGSTQLHEMKLVDDVMKMQAVENIVIPANQKTLLKPGGLHIMLMDLKSPLVLGERVPIKLKFKKAGEVSVDVVVQARPLPSASPEGAVPQNSSPSPAQSEHKH